MSDAEHYERLMAAFEALRSLDPQERGRQLQSLQTIHPTWIAQLKALLEMDAEPRSALDEGAARFHRTPIDDDIRAAFSARHDDRLEAESLLDEGGMGVIDIVFDNRLERRIARKTIQPDLVDGAGMRRFLREVRITARLSHPSITPVYDLGTDANGRPYFTMKLIEGEHLGQRLLRLPPGPLGRSDLWECLDVVVRVCEALAFAHRRGIVHCDVKPSNIMIGELGEVYLMDWGVARLVGEDPEQTDSFGTGAARGTSDDVLGSPLYMAPEQARGDRRGVDVRTDVFGVGAVLFEIATRRKPRPSAATLVSALLQAATGDIEIPATEIAPGLRAVIERALQRDPANRYASIVELRRDLIRLQRGETGSEERRLTDGEWVFNKGDEGDTAYVILSGECEVYATAERDGAPIRSMGEGEIFGELALLGEGKRTASVVAKGETVLRAIDGHVLQRELTSLPPWMANLLESLARRFRERDSHDQESA